MHISLAVSLGGRVEKAVVSEMSSFFFVSALGIRKTNLRKTHPHSHLPKYIFNNWVSGMFGGSAG